MFIGEIISADTAAIHELMLILTRKIHIEGPIHMEDMEQLAYVKKFYPQVFNEYEKELIYLMGLFYKVDTPESMRQIVYQIFAEEIEENTGHKFTPIQASAYTYIHEKKYFSFSAPTSAGKSFLFRELIEEEQSDIVIVLPSRALIAEYMYAVKELFKDFRNQDGKSVLVLDFIENINITKTFKRVYIITPERGSELFKIVDDLNIGLFLFDEAQISDEKKSSRGLRFDIFVRKVGRVLPNAKKVFTHPFVDNPEAQLLKHNFKDDAIAVKYTQSSVGKIFIQKKNDNSYYFSPFDENTYRATNTLKVDDDLLNSILDNNGTILVYISKSKIYQNIFQTEFSNILSKCRRITDPKGIEIINELKEYIGATNSGEKKSSLIELMKRGIVIHHGSIPLKARLLIEKFINANYAKVCFATSTLIQGINMPFDIVWIDNFKFEGDNSDKILGLKNLIGRSGRTLSNEKAIFDYGYVIVKSSNIKTFSQRIKSNSRLNETSIIEDVYAIDGDSSELANSIRNDTYNDDYNLPQVQVDRLTNEEVSKNILYLLDVLFYDNIIISGNHYNSIKKSQKDKIKDAFKKIYRSHLSRDLEQGESAVISVAIPILLWRVQSKSFKEIISLRYSYITQNEERRNIERKLNQGLIRNVEATKLINDLLCKLSVVASSLPDKTLSAHAYRFRNIKAIDLNYDLLVYDTYDYIDKVISFSLADPLCAAFQLYYASTQDIRALALSNMIRFGTNDNKEIWLMKYGFDSEDIEWIKSYVNKIDANGIEFNDSIIDLEEWQLEMINAYI